MSSENENPLVYEAPSWLKELDKGPGVNREQIKNRNISETYCVIDGDAAVADLFPDVEVPETLGDGKDASRGGEQETMVVDGGGPDTTMQWYVVIGRNGATIRKGVNLNTPLVTEIKRGTKVAVADTPKSYAEDTTKGSVRVYVRKPIVGWCSLKLLAECETPGDAAAAREVVAIRDVTDASTDTAGAQRAVEVKAMERARKLAEDFLSVRKAPGSSEVVGTVRKVRMKVTVVEFSPGGLHCGESNDALDARKDGWARITSPCEGWVPLCALESDNVCARRYRLNDPEALPRPPNIVPNALNGDGTQRRYPIRAACLHDAGTTAHAFAAGDIGGIAAYMKRHEQMTLVYGEGDLKVYDGHYVLRGDRYVVDEAAVNKLEPPPKDGKAPNCVGNAWMAHAAVEDADGKKRYEYRGVAEALHRLVRFLADDGVKWRERQVNGCRFAIAHGQGADLMTIFWGMCVSGHMHDALKGCGDEGSGFPRSFKDRSRYVNPDSAWFMPIAACLVGGNEFGWADQLDMMGQPLAIELRRLLKNAPPDATPTDLGYKLKYGCDRHGTITPLFSRSRLEFPSLHIVGKNDVHRASAERLYCMYSDGSRRIMYYDGKTEMPDQEFYGAEVCRFVARAMMEDAGTTYDYGPASRVPRGRPRDPDRRSPPPTRRVHSRRYPWRRFLDVPEGATGAPRAGFSPNLASRPPTTGARNRAGARRAAPSVVSPTRRSGPWRCVFKNDPLDRVPARPRRRSRAGGRTPRSRAAV